VLRSLAVGETAAPGFTQASENHWDGPPFKARPAIESFWNQAGVGFQLCGRSSEIRVMGWVAMRERMSLNQAKGSTPNRWQEAVKLRRTAAVVPPWSLPKNIQLLRPTATPRMSRSVADADRAGKVLAGFALCYHAPLASQPLVTCRRSSTACCPWFRHN
jgi:hypothetical protein